MTICVLDPTSETNPHELHPAPRPDSLQGKTVGIISNGKKGTAGFFAHLDKLMRERFDVADVVLRTKLNYSAPAEETLLDEVKNWDIAISGLGD
jgi:hypothetical protein